MDRIENFKKPETRAGRLYRCMEKFFFLRKKFFCRKKNRGLTIRTFFSTKNFFFKKKFFSPYIDRGYQPEYRAF